MSVEKQMDLDLRCLPCRKDEEKRSRVKIKKALIVIFISLLLLAAKHREEEKEPFERREQRTFNAWTNHPWKKVKKGEIDLGENRRSLN